jgi:Glyoxalase-like domain
MAVTERVFFSMDCADPGPLAEFWAAMLGGEVFFSRSTAAGVRAGSVRLATIRIEDYQQPSWPDGDCPKQMHLDLGVTDLDAAVAEAERLGARVAAYQPAPDKRRVLLDPAGHPFCLTTLMPPED